jgi:hypothetical protein
MNIFVVIYILKMLFVLMDKLFKSLFAVKYKLQFGAIDCLIVSQRFDLKPVILWWIVRSRHNHDCIP